MKVFIVLMGTLCSLKYHSGYNTVILTLLLHISEYRCSSTAKRRMLFFFAAALDRRKGFDGFCISYMFT